MSYQIIYGEETTQKSANHGIRRILLTFVFFFCFLWSVFRFWPEGKEVLQRTMIPGDPQRTMEAAEVFAQELSCGFPLADAARNFRDTVFEHEDSD